MLLNALKRTPQMRRAEIYQPVKILLLNVQRLSPGHSGRGVKIHSASSYLGEDACEYITRKSAVVGKAKCGP